MRSNLEFRGFRRAILRGAPAAIALVVVSPSRAQTPPPTPSAPPEAGADRVAALEAVTKKQQEQIDALLARQKKEDDELAALQEQAAAAPTEETSTPNKLLSAWGYFDLDFGGIGYDNPNALYRVATPAHATFFSSGVNIYLKSEITRTLSALIETRLTFTPHGYENNWPTEVRIGGTTIQTFNTLKRVDTSTRGPYSQLVYRQNGIFIERAYMDWKPADWFGVRVGRFLTPFGIWNEDHGSPVLIGVDYPQFMNFGFVPLWQLGVQVFGSVGLADDLRLDYALTLTNNRGPLDEYKDFNDMKAFGARLKLVYSPDPFVFRLGAYAYFSHYRDETNEVHIQLTPTLTLDDSYNPSFGSFATVTRSYDDDVLTGDAEFRWKRLRVIAEVARQTTIYDVPRKVDDDDKLLKGVPLTQTIYDPSHYGYGGYVLAAYEIPFHTSLLDFTVTPYAGYDYIVPSTTIPTRNNTQVRGGLNIKPSPYVTLKAEVTRIIAENKSVASDGTAFITQASVSF